MDIDQAKALDIFDSMQQGVALLDAQARLQWINRQFAKWFFPSGPSGLSSPFVDLLDSNSVSGFLSRMGDLVRHETSSFDLTWELEPEPGQHRWLRGTFTAMDNDPGLFMVLVDDLTFLMDERSQLEQARLMAEQATSSKSTFLATMSHEIRTPIHTVTGMVGLLRETALDGEQRDYVDQIGFAADVLLGIINDILDISKIEAGKLSLERIEFSLVDIISSAVDFQALEAFRKGLEVILDLDPRMPVLTLGDPVRVRQVLMNLLSNAIKFTAKGHIAVKTRHHVREGGQHSVRFEVLDSGMGIPEHKLAGLFQAFNQVDSSMTRRFGGSGLGLSICQNLVRLMGGEIGALSMEGKGSTFWFELPLTPGPEGFPRPTRSLPLKKRKILVVDDDPDTRKCTRHMLEWAGALVFEADGGTQGLSMMRASVRQGSPFELAIVDLVMPGMDGWRFASEVNADKEINATRLVLASPPGTMGAEAKMKLLNWVDVYLSKPLKSFELVPAVTKLFEGVLDLAGTVEDQSGDLQQAEDESNAGESRGRILVAEDHFVNQKLFQTILQRSGYETIVADDGVAAVEKALESHPDLIFMDVQMPRMNGYEATVQLRKQGVHCPIVAVTANAVKGDLEKCLQSGMDDYLSKPFTKDEVLACLEKWKTGRKVPRSAARTGPTSAKAVFDYEMALASFMSDAEILDSVLLEFRKKTPGQLEKLHQAIRSKESRVAEIIAHTLKGSSLNLGINRFGHLAGAMEAAIRQHRFDLANDNHSRLVDAWSEFERFFQEHGHDRQQ